MTTLGARTITFKVTDSAGYSATQTIMLTVLDYYAPTVTVQFARCTSTGVDDPLGIYIKYLAATTYTDVDSNSIQSVVFAQSGLTRNLTADGQWHLIDQYTQAATSRTENVVTVTDKFTSTSIECMILSANYAIYLNAGGTAIGFGGATEHTNSVEVAVGRTLYVPTKVDAGTVEYDSLVASSSRTIKHDIERLGDFGDAIDALVPVTFVYDSDDTETQRIGLIYEDTLQVMPEICTPEGENKAISYIELVPILLKEIQNLRNRLAAVEGAMS